jgi:hypothetical protein
LTVQTFGIAGNALTLASWAFLIGGLSMPVCCLLMAHFPRALPLFGVPVVSLLLGGTLTVIGIAHGIRQPPPAASLHQTKGYVL